MRVDGQGASSGINTNGSGIVTIRDSTAIGFGAYSRGMILNGASVFNSYAEAGGGLAATGAIVSMSSDDHVHNSVINGDLFAVYAQRRAIVRIYSSMIGGDIGSKGHYICVNSYDDSLQVLDDSCTP